MKKIRDLSADIVYRTSRSSGSGGQHVNKVSSKVELLFDLQRTSLLSEEEKKLLLEFPALRTGKDGVIRLVCQADRSQHKNKETVTARFYKLIAAGLKKKKKRIRTGVPDKEKEKRRQDKKRTSEKKKLRRTSGE